MNYLKRISRLLLLNFLTAACWLAMNGLALAKEIETEQKPSASTAYTGPYFLVIVCVCGGLVFVLRPSKRRDRERPEGYVKKSELHEEGD